MSRKELIPAKLDSPRARELYSRIAYHRQCARGGVAATRNETHVLGRKIKDACAPRSLIAPEGEIGKLVQGHPFWCVGVVALAGLLLTNRPRASRNVASVASHKLAKNAAQPLTAVGEIVREELASATQLGIESVFGVLRQHIIKTAKDASLAASRSAVLDSGSSHVSR